MTIETGNRLLPGLGHRPTELGRIRLGDKTVNKQGKELPVKLETWRLTSGNRAALQVAADIYGGTVEEWTDAPDEGMWELLTDSNALQVLIPRVLRTLSQWYEWWQGGTCERRCDGTTEQISGLACICKDEGTMECRPRTRLNIMLPDVPGLGVWRLETDGWNAATSLPATIEMLLSLSVQPWVKAVLRLEQRSARKRQEDGRVVTHRFAVPVLDTPNDLTLGRIVSQRLHEEPVVLPATAGPTTARERIAEQRAEIEARTTNGGGRVTTLQADGVETVDDVDDPGPAEPAGARAATSTEKSSSPDSGTSGKPGTMPAPDDSGGKWTAPESSPARCDAFSAELGACVRSAGHTGNHANKDRETWK